MKISKNEVLQDLSNVIFSLNKNQISEIIETPLAKQIVVLNEIYPKYQKTFIESYDEIATILQEVETNNFMIVEPETYPQAPGSASGI